MKPPLMNLQLTNIRKLCHFASLTILCNLWANPVQPTETQAANHTFAYVGTLSSPIDKQEQSPPPNHGRGIHYFELDPSSGCLTPVGVVELPNSPSCLVVDKKHGRLYSANETDRIAPNGEGSVSSFALDSESGLPSLLSTVRSGGTGPTHISIHPTGKFLLVANYVTGAIAAVPISADGKLSEPVDVKVVEGTIGPKRAKNAPLGSFARSGHDRSHAHMI